MRMDHISVRELRNSGGRVLQRVANGETLTVTLDGEPIAELRPLSGRGVRASELLRRWKALPPIDVAAFRADVDAVIDMTL
ncbi:MAG: type II toxin-antitoxin system prevent-host-death family antitoxin [Gemmatimonadaceae bacterium]